MSKEYDILKLCKKNKAGTYEIDPAVMFPATIARMQECVKGDELVEIVSKGWPGRADREPVADKFLRQAEGFPREAWDLAMTPFDQVHDANLLALRAEVLVLAEQWFKRALALAHGEKGVKVFISKNLDWKR